MINFKDYPNFSKFKGLNILSIDYGLKVTGLAHFCPGREPFPSPLGRITYKNDEQLIKDLKHYIDEECIELLVLGIPFYLDGNESEMTKIVRVFHEKLKQSYPSLEIYLQDETLSSSAAEERMMTSPQYNFKVDPKKIDEVAATIILEDFMTKTTL